jgi:hypothetical protein
MGYIATLIRTHFSVKSNIRLLSVVEENVVLLSVVMQSVVSLIVVVSSIVIHSVVAPRGGMYKTSYNNLRTFVMYLRLKYISYSENLDNSSDMTPTKIIIVKRL